MTTMIIRSLIGPSKVRQLQRTLNNLRTTVLCGLLTILVLRGTIGAGRFGTPAQDFHHLRSHLPRSRSSSRILSELHTRSRSEPEQHARNPMEEDPNPNPKFLLGPEIPDWDAQRAEFLKTTSNDNSKRMVKERIMLVTGSQPAPCDNPVGDHYLLKSLKNKLDYCRIHDIQVFYNMAHLDSSMSGYWAKLPLLRNLLLAHPEVEWLWWMDSDAILTDMSFRLPLERYNGLNIILHGWDELVYNRRSWIGLNTGSFLIRNCEWSLRLLEAWAPMGPKGRVRDEAGKVLTSALTGRPEFEADDQSALVYLLSNNRGTWGRGVYLESSYYLHGYWAILVDRFEEMMKQNRPGSGDDRWPLVTHFVGCKPCGRFGDYPVERCLREMERAFNFGDNQVLATYGFQHQGLESSSVRRVRNESERPIDDVQRRALLLPLHRTSLDLS